MALSDDLRERVVGAVVEGGMSRNAAAKRFGVSIASAVRWVARFKAKGEISPAPTGGDRRSGRIEVDDVDAFAAQLNEKRYRNARPHPETQPWGVREMTIADPFGNRVTFWTTAK